MPIKVKHWGLFLAESSSLIVAFGIARPTGSRDQPFKDSAEKQNQLGQNGVDLPVSMESLPQASFAGFTDKSLDFGKLPWAVVRSPVADVPLDPCLKFIA